MKKEDLFKLREKCFEEFDNPLDLEMKVKSIITDPSKIPMVTGYKKWKQEDWYITPLSPATPSEELTVRNYLEGLRKVQEANLEFKRYHPEEKFFKDFKGIIMYQGIDTKHYSNQDTKILSIAFGMKNSENFNLNIYWNGSDSKERILTYGAENKVEPSRIRKIMEPHLGPIKKYKRIF
jgi:hypothetical protein